VECQKCGEDVEDLQPVRAGGKRMRVCEDCASALAEADEIAAEATTAMQGMMEYKGGRRS
jgi:ribosome-binding protein aMBF1 (putative translation factor)